MLRNYGNNASAREFAIKQLKYELKISDVYVSGNRRTIIDILTEFFDQQDESHLKKKHRL